MQALENPAQIVHAVVTKTIDEWKEKNPPAKIEKDTLKLLNKNAEEILLKLLGFNKDSWGRGNFQLDHCNGRSGESAAGDYIRRHQQEAINKWLSQVPMPEMPKTLITAMKAEAGDRYRRHFQEQFYARVEAHAEAEANKAFDAISATLFLDKYNKTLNLINSNDSPS
jgi:hypothetical protein